MSISRALRDGLRVPYTGVRLLLQLADQRAIVPAFGEDSTAHKIVTTTVSRLDEVAATVFASDASDDKGTTSSGATAPSAPEPEPATATEAADEAATEADTEAAREADARPENVIVADTPLADDTIDEARSEDWTQPRSIDPIDTAEQHEIDELAESYVDAEQVAPGAGELAEDDEIRRVQAEIRAKQQIEEQHGQL